MPHVSLAEVARRRQTSKKEEPASPSTSSASSQPGSPKVTLSGMHRRNTPPPSGTAAREAANKEAFDALVAALHRINYFQHCGIVGCPFTWDPPTARGVANGAVAPMRRVMGYLVHYFSDSVVAAVRGVENGRICLESHSDERFVAGLKQLLPTTLHGDVHQAFVYRSPRSMPDGVVCFRVSVLTRVVEAFEQLAGLLPPPAEPVLDRHRVRLNVLCAKYRARHPSAPAREATPSPPPLRAGGAARVPMADLLHADMGPLEHVC